MSDSASSSKGSSLAPNTYKLFIDEENKTEEARSKFIELEKCTYSSKHLGNSRTNDFMECDCYEEFNNNNNNACGENSDCINRLTLIECVNDLCSTCGNDCQNQRFQKKQYADVAVFQTDKKGYGVRAERDIEAHEFIYEYIGEVISEEEFHERMFDYDQRQFKHFYFMMLQTGEFIDATIKGSLARFCNHSCNPNAYVNKWVVAGKLKMGIFSNRKILKGEEITFDYNVDRYGANAQVCYCEEPSCIGFLGGKTQTNAASLLPQNYSDALGVTPSIEKKWLKMKKAKGEPVSKSTTINVNTEFVDSLTLLPCSKYEDVNKIMSALLQVDDNFIASKLLERLLLTKDEQMHYQIIKLHGYRCFVRLLNIFDENVEKLREILHFLNTLPKTTKNGIILSQIEEKVTKLKSNSKLQDVVQDLLSKWNSYETYKRISKRDMTESSNKMFNIRRRRLPPGWEIVHENGRPFYYNAQKQIKSQQPPNEISSKCSEIETAQHSRFNSSFSNADKLSSKRLLDPDEYERKKRRRIERELQELEKLKQEEIRQLKERMELDSQKKSELEKIIFEANKQKELEKEERQKKEQEAADERHKRKSLHSTNYYEYKWNKFFAIHVPNMIKHYESEIDHKNIKSCARDIVKILSGKEIKKDSKKSPPQTLTKEKRAKVKAFIQAYMDKFLKKVKEKSKPTK